MNRLRQPEILGGILIGIGAAVFAWVVHALVGGRWLNDPLPIALIPGAVMRASREGFTYFDARSPLLHVLFIASIGMLSGALAVRLELDVQRARSMSRIAAGIGIVIVAVREVDAFTVLLYYAIAALASLFICGYAADKSYRYLLKRQATSLS